MPVGQQMMSQEIMIVVGNGLPIERYGFERVAGHGIGLADERHLLGILGRRGQDDHICPPGGHRVAVSERLLRQAQVVSQVAIFLQLVMIGGKEGLPRALLPQKQAVLQNRMLFRHQRVALSQQPDAIVHGRGIDTLENFFRRMIALRQDLAGQGQED